MSESPETTGQDALVAAPVAAPAESATVAERLLAAEARAEAAEQALAAALAAAPPADLIADLQRQIAELSARLEARERAELFAAAEGDGRLIAGTPLQRYAEGLALEPLKGLLSSLTPVAALAGTQTGGRAPEGAAFSAALRAEFGDEAAWKAYEAAVADGRVKILNTSTAQ